MKFKKHQLFASSLAVLLSMLSQHRVFACLDTLDSYPGDSRVQDGATSFSEYSYLISNYKYGMVIESAYVCQKTFNGATLLIGFSFNLVNRSTGESSTGTYNGLDSTDYPGDTTVVCQTQYTTGTVYEVVVGID